MGKPVLFFAFANEPLTSTTYLRNLAKEAIHLRKVLIAAEADDLCEFVLIEHATLEEIVATFQSPKYRGRIAVFHFAGHAGNDRLFVNDAEAASTSARGEGLVPFLAGQAALQLVFLNGCHTRGIGRALTEAGLPAVIGTAEAVRDEVATELAIAFYRGLCRGLQLDRAWNEAVAVFRASANGDDPARLYRPETVFREDIPLAAAPQLRFPWSLRYRPGREDSRYWNLPGAAANPLFGLPAIDRRHDLPNEPYAYLRPYGPERARLFFGRGSEIYQLYHRLSSDTTSPIQLLYGQSGVGKSSLLTAGLLPRLAVQRTIRSVRRTRERGLRTDLDHLLAESYAATVPPSEPDSGEWPDRWRAIERATAKPLIVILDQVEELFTRPSQAGGQELEQFVRYLLPGFASIGRRPQGKLVLSYRKEFHPEIDQALRRAGLPFGAMFLDKLTTKGIEEIVTGLTSTEAHRTKYQLRIEEKLPQTIAAELLRDSDSPVAPVLQILLTKLWQRGTAADGTRNFSLANYRELQRQGLYLEDFFQEQLRSLAAWGRDRAVPVVASGLALDVLNYHTTPYGTAESRSLSELLAQYSHHRDLLPELIRELQSLYLLSETEAGRISLAHDTLATIIRREIRMSDLPGQRALRLLETKMLDFRHNPDATILGEEDLQTVENGRTGMRAWSPEEQRLIDLSRDHRERARARRRRSRGIQWAGVAAIVFALVFVSIAWRNSRLRARGNEFVAAALATENTDPTRSLELVDRAANYLPGAPAVRQARHDIFSHNEFYDTTLYFEAPVVQVALAPNDSILAAASGTEVSLWSAGELRPLAVLSHDVPVTHVSFAPDGKSILTGTDGDGLLLWDTRGRIIGRYGRSRSIASAAIAPDRRHLLAADREGQVVLWTNRGDTTLILDGFFQPVAAVAFSPGGDTLLVGNEVGELQFFDTLGTRLSTISAHRDRILSLDWRAGSGILSASRDATAALWTATGSLSQRLTGHEKRVNAAQWLPASDYILTASDDYSVRLWTTAGQPRNRYRGHTDFVNSIAVARSERWFASGSADSTLRVWRLESKVADRLLPREGSAIASLAVSRDSDFIVAGTQPPGETTADAGDFFDFLDRIDTQPQPLLLWRPPVREPILLAGHTGRINSVAISPSGDYFLSGAAGGKAILWRASGEQQRSFVHGSEVTAVAFAPDGATLLTAGSDSLAILWDTTGRKLAILPHGGLVSAVAWLPDGTGFYTAGFDQAIRHFDREGRLLAEWNGHDNRVSCLAVSPDGREILSGDWDNRVIRWSAQGEIIGSYTLNAKNSTGGAAIKSVAFSPDGAQIAIGAEDGLVKLLTPAGRELHTLSSLHSEDFFCLTFDPGTGRLLTGGETGVRIWYAIDAFRFRDRLPTRFDR